MNKRELKKFEKLLLARRERLAGSIRNIEEASRGGGLRENTVDLADCAEVGSDTFELETALNIASGESDRLDEISDALRRVRNGTYGTCEMCEEPIPKPRLEVFPSARYCVNCKEKVEKEEGLR